MTATEIITRALYLADLRNSDFITYNDKAQSLFESYRDIYSTLVDADDDYFLTDTVIDITSAYVDANSSGTLTEWNVPMPADCMRVRNVSYNGFNKWTPMQKFANINAFTQTWPPRYRWQNGNLKVIGSSAAAFSQLRVWYYAQQPIATVPEDDIIYGGGITQLSDKGLVTYPSYVDQDRSLLYVYNGLNIQIDSADLATNSVVLYTGATTITDLRYYAGYIYFIMGGAIYRAPYLQTGTIVPTSIISSPASITSVTVSTADQKLYYSEGTNIYSAGLDGSGAATYQTFPGTSVYAFGSEVIYVDATGALKTVSGATLVASGISSASTDGTTFIFYLTTSGLLYSATLDATPALTNATLLRNEITYCGPWFQSGYVYPGTIPAVQTGRLPVLDRSLDILAISSVVDYDFSYPLNEANEIMSYQCAIDFGRKRNADTSQLRMRLGIKSREAPDGTASGLWGRLERSIIDRDDYRPERIGNTYLQRGWW